MNQIPATVGILTFNSGKTLVRCLESVKDFREIIIADGGSTDDTLDIARRYGARIISQSAPGKPIDDFARERNILLDATTEDWFFYVDSDEAASPELSKSIRAVANGNTEHKVYQVRYFVTTPDFSIKYRTMVPYYQPRFFNTRIGARFISKVHEKITWDKERYPAGIVDAPWYVPLDSQLDFSVYRRKVERRLPFLLEHWKPTLSGALRKGVWEPLVTSAKQLIKMTYLHLRYPARELVPFRYDCYRLYSQWVMVRSVWKAYMQSIRLKASPRAGEPGDAKK